jgi:hypothetical protein
MLTLLRLIGLTMTRQALLELLGVRAKVALGKSLLSLTSCGFLFVLICLVAHDICSLNALDRLWIPHNSWNSGLVHPELCRLRP